MDSIVFTAASGSSKKASVTQQQTEHTDTLDSADKTVVNTQTTGDSDSKAIPTINETLVSDDASSTERLRTLHTNADSRLPCSVKLDSIDIENYTDVSFEEDSFGTLVVCADVVELANTVSCFTLSVCPFLRAWACTSSHAFSYAPVKLFPSIKYD